MIISGVLSRLQAPASCEAGEAEPVKQEYVLVSGPVSIEAQAFQDVAELNNRVVTLSKLMNLSVEELVQGRHILVFASPPLELNAPSQVVEVLRG